MSSPRMMPRDRDSEHGGSPAPRIRVGYTNHSDGPGGNRQQTSQGLQHRDSFLQSQAKIPTLSSFSLSASSMSGRDQNIPGFLQTIDHQLGNIAQLLTEAVLLPLDSPVDPAMFLSLGCLELYDQDQRICVQSLREERGRLLDRRQGIEMEGMRQETAQVQLKAEEKRLQHLEMATETAALTPESLAPMSSSRIKLLDDLGNILSKIRMLVEIVHVQREESQEQLQQDMEEEEEKSHRNQYSDPSQALQLQELQLQQQKQEREDKGRLQTSATTVVTVVSMDMFQRHGLMDLYDRDPAQCVHLLRVEHARLAARRDDLELEYERQRTALLRTMQ